MKDHKTAWRWFWPWEDDKEGHWLEQMASQGWHWRQGIICYKFDRGEPTQLRYRLDYHTNRKDMDEYLSIFRDAGWERVREYSGWQYFRTSDPAAPEVFTDAASRIAKYQRLLGFLLLVMMPLLLCNLPTLINNWQPDSIGHNFRLPALWGVLVLYLLWGYILVRLGLFIRKLKKQNATELLTRQGEK